jgi:hypothetical protein
MQWCVGTLGNLGGDMMAAVPREVESGRRDCMGNRIGDGTLLENRLPPHLPCAR